jgi:hypothetical protein
MFWFESGWRARPSVYSRIGGTSRFATPISVFLLLALDVALHHSGAGFCARLVSICI